MTSLQRQLRWYISLRLLVMASIFVAYGLVSLTAGEATLLHQPSRFLLEFFGLTCGATLLYILLLFWLPQRAILQAYSQFVGDLLLISYLILTFGPNSPFSPLYLVVIVVASAMLGQQAALTVASIAYLLFGGLQVSFAFQLPLTPGPGPIEGLSYRLAYSLLVNFVGLFATAWLTSWLIRRVRLAEHALEEQREDLADLRIVHRDVVESIPSGICTTDLAGLIVMINRTGRQILALEDEDLLGRPIHESPLFSREQWESMTLSTSQSGVRLRSELSLDRAGEPVFIGFSISRLTDSEGDHQGYIVIFQDLTHWRKLEEQVRLKDRMAAVGEMAAGLAHEIGNPLAAISGSVQLLSRAGPPADSERKLLDILFKESQRLDRTIKGFLRFARPRERASVHFDIAALLAENVELLRNSPEISPNHRVELELIPLSAIIPGDPDQISQIFWNLARNALKAMPEGGGLTLRGATLNGSYVMQFTDTGRGMSEEERANLFHPFQSFFDTGTGIGMAIVYQIVQEHGGHLSVDSSPGRGCTITVELPAVAPAGEGGT